MKLQFIVLALLALTVNADIGVRCGTQDAYEALLLGECMAPRPSDGPLYVYTTNFIVHYDTVGIHACTPAYAESIAVYAEYVRSVEVGGVGFAPPPPDFAGPDTRYDIYVQHMTGYTGLTSWGGYYPNPYPTGRASYIFVLNTMTWEYLRPLVAHEFNHACQARYSDQYNWWYENVACWAEDLCYDDVNWYIISLNTSPNPLDDLHLSIENIDNEFEYASQIWAMFLQEYYGSSCLRLVWEEIGQVGGDNVLDAINTVLLNYDSDLKMALGNYAVWRYFTGARADTLNCFSESHLWPTSYINPVHQHTGPGSGNQGINALDGPGGTCFIEFYTYPEYLLKNSIDGLAGADWRVYNVGYGPLADHRQYLMDSEDYWSIIPTMLHDTTVLIPTVTSFWQNQPFDYSGESICLTPAPPQDQEMEITSILSPGGVVSPYSNTVPSAERCNNASTSSVDTAWVSFYIGEWYGDSHEFGQLATGETDTVSFDEWIALERNTLDILCVGGGNLDTDLMNNYSDGSVQVTLDDFEVLEILSPRGVVPQNVPVAPSVLIQNNGTSSGTVSVVFTVESYTDMSSIYLEPESSGGLFFDDWIPTQLGACSTSCSITTMDQRPMNDVIIGEVYVSDETGIEEGSGLPPATLLHVPVPNPFTSSTTISFELAESGDVRLDVYDLHGRLVETLEDGILEAGEQTLGFDGSGLSDGIYFIKLTTETATRTERCVLIK